MRCHDVIFTCFSGVELSIVSTNSSKDYLLHRILHGRIRDSDVIYCFCEAFPTSVRPYKEAPFLSDPWYCETSLAIVGPHKSLFPDQQVNTSVIPSFGLRSVD